MEEINNMQFAQEDLLTNDDILLLIVSDLPHKKAKLIASKLIKYGLIYRNSVYVLQSNLTYAKYERDVNAKITNLTTQLIETSFEGLEEVTRQNIKIAHSEKKNHYSKIFSNANVDRYLPQLVEYMTKSNIVFDLTLRELHYNNGYIDLNDKEFKERVYGTHYITKYINRDYKKSTSKQQNKLLQIIHKICPKQDDLSCIMLIIGSALSGESCKDQDTLFLLGPGSSGKSVIMTLTMFAIECYFKELKSDTFSMNNKTIDKTLNTYANEPQIRISWVNELDATKIDGGLFKKFCEGKLQTTKLYTEGCHDIVHYSKCISTANLLPVIQVDSGIERRFYGYTHKSSFIDDESKVDEKKHIYLKNKNLLEEIKNWGLLDSWVDILTDYCYKWLLGEKPQYTENFNDTKDIVMNSNDFVLDFIDAKIQITNLTEDRISKNEMHKCFKEMYPAKFLTVQQLIGDLKDKQIMYNAKFRCDNIQGCYVGVKFRKNRNSDSDYQFESEDTSVLQEMCDDFKKLYEEADKKNEMLTKRIKELELKLLSSVVEEPEPEPVKKKLMKIIKKTKSVFKESESDFTTDDADYIRKMLA